jgi:hypothetical protein
VLFDGDNVEDVGGDKVIKWINIKDEGGVD